MPWSTLTRGDVDCWLGILHLCLCWMHQQKHREQSGVSLWVAAKSSLFSGFFLYLTKHEHLRSSLDFYKRCWVQTVKTKKNIFFPDLNISVLIGHIQLCHSGRNISENTPVCLMVTSKNVSKQVKCSNVMFFNTWYLITYILYIIFALLSLDKYTKWPT